MFTLPKRRNIKQFQQPQQQTSGPQDSGQEQTPEDLADDRTSGDSGSDANQKKSGENANRARDGRSDSGQRGDGNQNMRSDQDEDDRPESDKDAKNGEGKDPGTDGSPEQGSGKSPGDSSSVDRGKGSPRDGAGGHEKGGPSGRASGAGSHGKSDPSGMDGMNGSAADTLKGIGRRAGHGARQAGQDIVGGAISGARGLGNAIFNGATGFGKSVAHGMNMITGKVGSALGISKVASSILVGVVAFGSIGGAAVAGMNYAYEQKMLKQEYIQQDDCEEDVASAMSIATPPAGDDAAMQYANAQKAWSVFKALGLTDEQAAGAIGNMVGEGGLSPYTMECDFITAPNEKWYIGPIKQGFLADLNAWTVNQVFPYYTNISLNHAFYGTSRHGYVAGVGLCGFTGCNYDDLEDWAAGLGTTWHDEAKAFEVQMSFIIAPGSNGGYGGPGGASDWLANWGSDTSGCSTPAAAAVVFCERFEGITMVADAKLQAAEYYYNEFKGSMGDTTYADSILQMAQTSRAGAAGNAVSGEADDCGVEAGVYDNSDLAKAAVAYAYETKDQGRGNDGTELYQALHRAIFPGDPWFQSCDRGVATAVRWAGADDNFPAGATGQQLTYLNEHSEKWESLGASVTLQDANELQPGDICVCDGHIVMYVGNETVKAKFPNADSSSDFVSASLNERSPGCGHDDFHYDSRPYVTFRLKQYETNSQYTNIIDGQDLNDR